MSKIIRLVLSACMAVSLIYGGDLKANALSGDEIFSEAAVLMDAQTGQVLFNKNMSKRMYPASTTKIMTGIIALENALPSQILTVSREAVDIREPESSNIALTSGEELTLDSAMYALMLPSANDAANVIAENVAGSVEEFADLMNRKASQIGAKDTSFLNPHGLHEDGHYTTAYDLALITRYASQNSDFMRYFGAQAYTMPPTNKQPLERPFSNYQYMLLPSTRFFYEGVTGGKTGFTNPAKHTMSTIATKDGRTLICVVMYSANRDDKFADTKKLLDFGFKEFSSVTIDALSLNKQTVPVLDAGATAGEALFSHGGDITFLLHNSVNPSSVRVEYDIPGFVDASFKNAAASISFYAWSAEELVPTFLMTKQIIPKIQLNSQYSESESVVAAMSDMNSGRGAFSLRFFLIAAGCMAAIFSLASAYKRYAIVKRRKRRMERINRLMGETTFSSGEKPGKITYRTSYWM